jgi:hypothetical protein
MTSPPTSHCSTRSFFDVLDRPLDLREVLRVVADAIRLGRSPDDP